MLALVAFLWFLVPDLDQAVDEDLSVPDDGAEGRLAREDVFERAAVGREGVEVQALRVGAVAEELRDPDRGVLGGGEWVSSLESLQAVYGIDGSRPGSHHEIARVCTVGDAPRTERRARRRRRIRILPEPVMGVGRKGQPMSLGFRGRVRERTDACIVSFSVLRRLLSNRVSWRDGILLLWYTRVLYPRTGRCRRRGVAVAADDLDLFDRGADRDAARARERAKCLQRERARASVGSPRFAGGGSASLWYMQLLDLW